ncbi:MAG: hypothetical protein KDC38_03470 [Planctomycetes bacterium]|nr:hypothetical protein [Planctomycetota bacterium]
MSLFKSKDERRIDREIEVRKGLNAIRRNIRDLEKNEEEYLEKAKRAARLGSDSQLKFLKQTLKRTASQRLLMERQLLNIETAMQIKNQAEAHAQFANSMNAVSKAIGDAFGRTDLTQTQREFERAMAKAESLEQQMDIFIDMSSSSMFGYEPSGSEVISDQEIDRMIDAEVLAVEDRSELDEEIASGLEAVRRELGHE